MKRVSGASHMALVPDKRSAQQTTLAQENVNEQTSRFAQVSSDRQNENQTISTQTIPLGAYAARGPRIL
jgi:hypothetical protein